MSGRLLVLCPGQGGQHAGMLDLARTDARASAFLDSCGLDLDPATMFENRSAQPLLVASALALWEALRSHVPAPALASGYSIGEVAAYGVAGALSPKDAVLVAATRAALMDAAALAHPGQAMAAIGGLAVERTRQLAQGAGFEIAIITGEENCIAGGMASALPQLENTVLAAGGRLQQLRVRVASHTSLMADAVAPFATALEAQHFGTQRCPVLSGIAATRVSGKAGAVEHLSRQLAQTIEWAACMDAAIEAGVTVALELGPCPALSRMFQARYPELPCRSTSEFRSIDGIVAWLGRHTD